MTNVLTYRSRLSQGLEIKKNIKSSKLTRPTRSGTKLTTLKGRKLGFHMRVVTLKGPITKPVRGKLTL